MSQLVDDLLWLARSDRIHVPTRMITIPLEDLLEDVLDQYSGQFLSQKLKPAFYR